jgi:uncharacterized protein YbjT (DUF2867 family)
MMMKVLVTGATGNVGSHTVRELRERGASVRAFVRDPGKAAAVLGDGVELAVGDFSDAASVRRALEGVEAVFLACSNDPRQVEYETGVIDAAAEAGVRRLVKLSALGAEVGSPLAFWDWHGRIEGNLRASGLPAVVLQPSFYMTNLFGAAEGVRHEGALIAPAERARISMIDPRDVAAAATVVLAEDGHEGETYVLTGTEPITYGRVAEELSAVAGRPIPFVAVPDEAARQALVGAGIPEFVAGQLVTLFRLLRRGAYERSTDAVCVLTERTPRTLAGFFRDHAELFRVQSGGPAAGDGQTVVSAGR